jgi:hypothetical protein
MCDLKLPSRWKAAESVRSSTPLPPSHVLTGNAGVFPLAWLTGHVRLARFYQDLALTAKQTQKSGAVQIPAGQVSVTLSRGERSSTNIHRDLVSQPFVDSGCSSARAHRSDSVLPVGYAPQP